MWAPQVLRVSLGRFDQFTGDQGPPQVIKRNNRITFQEELNLKNFYVNGGEAKYDLVGVTIHAGGATSGHSYTFAKVGGAWIKFNDKQTTETNWETVKEDGFGSSDPTSWAPCAYLLCYNLRQGPQSGAERSPVTGGTADVPAAGPYLDSEAPARPPKEPIRDDTSLFGQGSDERDSGEPDLRNKKQKTEVAGPEFGPRPSSGFRASSVQYEGPQPGAEDIMEGPAHLARKAILPCIMAMFARANIACPDTGDGNLTDEFTDQFIQVVGALYTKPSAKKFEVAFRYWRSILQKSKEVPKGRGDAFQGFVDGDGSIMLMVRFKWYAKLPSRFRH